MVWALTSNLTTLKIIKRQVKLGENIAVLTVPLVVAPLQSFPLTSTPANVCPSEGLCKH